jgi:fluoride ion exporter CrcB/FEX
MSVSTDNRETDEFTERYAVDGIEEELSREGEHQSSLLTPASISNKPSSFHTKAYGFTNHWLEHLLRDVLMLSLFSIFGVLTRIGLSLLFGPQHANVTSKTGALFYDLPPNAVGSFFMGIFVGGKSYIPNQSAPTIYLSFTTGYMGSVTTFASWNQQAVEMFAGGNKVAALFELVIGVELCYFSFMLGLHSELALKGLVRNYLRRLVQQPQEEETNNTSNGEYVQQHANTKGNGVVATEETPSRSSMVGSISRTSLEGHLEQIQRMLTSRKSTSSHSRRSISDDLLGPLAFHVNSIIERIGRKTISDERYQKDQVAVPSTQSAAVSKSVQKAAEESQRFSNKIILVGGFLFFVLAYGGFISAAVVDTDRQRRSYWFACIFGPFGAVSRWQLAALNRNIVWFPKGTFITNMIASAFDAAFAAVLLYHDEYWTFVVLHGLSLGFCGDMSTVSTFVGEMYSIEK